ncbi:MAG: hypothetical protein ACRCWD_03510 [Culicoidibacterales bacterium]
MKRIHPYLGLYRTMFIVVILVAIVYGVLNFTSYQESVRTFVTNENPSFVIERERYYRNQNYESAKENNPNISAEELDKLKQEAAAATPENISKEFFQVSRWAPTDNLDELWIQGIYARIIGTTLTFSFTVATIILALFALNHHKIAAIASTVGIFLVFISNQLTLLIATGIFGITIYNQYFFNFLEFIFIIALIGLTFFTIFVNPEFKSPK